MRNYRELMAVVVAGDKGKSHPVFGKNKAFLDVDGLPIIARVVSALDKAKSVSEIYVVGPKQELGEVLSGERACMNFGKPIHIFEQHTTLYENIWFTFLETLPSYRRGEAVEVVATGPDADSVVLVVAADMPLLMAAEVDEFVSKCDMDRCDYVVGVTLEEDLEHYYPGRGQSGIRLAYMHFKEGNFRQNNMHMVRPFRIQNRHYVQTMYDLRYQKEFGNILRLAWEILKREEGGWGAVGNYLLLQLSLLFARLRLGFLRDLVRRVTHADSIAGCISKLLKTRFAYAYTSLGGAALDIDNEREYETIKLRFSEWVNYQEEKAKQMPSRVGPK
ncbi:MAG: nucleotidyltransferase family protein [Candidatus Hydrogenedentota bacterium]|nr:MAG: nucleotidyltransferase family protein [Candidatus Hydrogenedentota bacterium]